MDHHHPLADPGFPTVQSGSSQPRDAIAAAKGGADEPRS